MNKHLLNFLVLFLFALVASFNLFRPGYFTMHDDLQAMRLYEMDRCLQDGQIPCRWSPDMDAGYGQPMFNFYSATPYYIGGLIKLVGISYLDTVKVLFFLCILATAIFSYLFFEQLFTPTIALVGAAAYLFIPYRALDLFVRGDITESWALALLPAVLAAVVALIKFPKPSKAVLFALSLAALFTSHNITSMIGAPFIIILAIFYLFAFGWSVKKILYLFAGGLLGFGLSAFFVLPVLIEKGLVNTQYLITDYFNFQNHFVQLKQLFADLHWGFGAPNIGPGGDISFFIGILPLASLVLLPLLIVVKRPKRWFEYGLYLALAILALFMTHSRSFFIWHALPALEYVQFPWRFLGIFALFSALLVSAIADQFRSIRKLPLLIILLAIALNIGLFKFGRYLPNETDKTKLSGDEFTAQQRSALLDYLPKTVTTIPKNIAPTTPQVLDGNVNINYFDNRTGYFSSEFDIYSKTAAIRFPVMYFPGWEVHLDRSPELMAETHSNDLGLITVELDKGHHLVQAFFENTLVRNIGNFMTFGSALVILSWLAIYYEKTKH